MIVPDTTGSAAPLSRASVAVLLAATLALAACGGGSSGDPEGSLAGDVPPDEDDPTPDEEVEPPGTTEPDAGNTDGSPETEPPETTEPDTGDTEGSPETDPPETSGPEPDAEPEIPLGRDDRPGLSVRFPGDREPGALSSPWLAVVDVFQITPRPTDTGDLYVELFRYADGLSFEESIDFYTPDIDACRIRDLDEESEGGGDEEDVDDGIRSVSGGAAVTLTSAGGEWLSVPFSREDGVYDGDNVFPGPAPDDLALVIPGSEFPAIAAVPIGVPSAPERLSPGIDEPITTATEYRWVAGGDDEAIVRIVFLNSLDGEFRGIPVSCRVLDNGAFELPEDARAALEGLPGETTVRYVRERRLLEFRDGVAVVQAVSIADD